MAARARLVHVCTRFSFFLEMQFDSWMDDCDVMSFSTVLQSYQDDVRVIMDNCVHDFI